MSREVNLLAAMASLADERAPIEEHLRRGLVACADYVSARVGHAFLVPDAEECAVYAGLWDGAVEPVGAFVDRTAAAIYPVGEGLVGRALATGEVFAVADLAEESDRGRRDAATELGLTAAVFVPVPTPAGVVAVLELYGDASLAPRPAALRALQAASVMLGRVVASERTRAEVTRRLAQLEIAERVGRLGAWEWHLEGETVDLSSALSQIVGLADACSLDEFSAAVQPDRPGALAQLIHSLERKNPSFTEYIEGDERRLVVGAEFIEGDDSVGDRVVGVVQDVTRQWREKEALLRANVRAGELAALTDELERSNAELDQFAYVTSHDLKAPLRGIANLAAWIQEDLGEQVSADTAKHLELLRGRVFRMESLIDAILEYARVGRKDGVSESVDVAALVRETVELLAPPSHVRVSIAGALPNVVSPRSPLRQVFHNLVGNAIKHAGAGGAGQIEVGARPAGRFVEFYVRDDGPGIDPRYHDRIFGVFQTLQSRDKVEGTGIGLAVVKKNVERRGGRVRVESAVGSGTTMWFSWPREATL